MSGTAQQAARLTDPVTHGLGMAGIVGGALLGAAAGALLLAALPATAGALVIGLTVAAATGAVAGGGLAGHQLITGIQRAGGLPSPATGLIGMLGSPNVRIGMLPAARAQADLVTACHGLFGSCHYPIPPVPPAPIAEGASSIRINGLFAARVGSRTVCGASVQRGAVAVYYGGPTQQVLAIFDLESLLLEGLGFVAKAALIAAGLFTIPLGLGAVAMFALVVGAFTLVNYSLGVVGDRLGDGWRDILQGSFGVGLLVVGARGGARAWKNSGASQQASTEARRAADAEQARGRDSGAAAGLSIDGRPFADVSTGETIRINEPRVQAALNRVVTMSRYHGDCAEIGVLNQVERAGLDPRGGTMRAVRLRRPGHAKHGTPLPPCPSCADVMRQFGINYD